MGVIKQGILGGFSGKVGALVGSSWKGIAVMKAKPLSVANPNTAGQVAQRTKFSNTVSFAVLILSGIIKPLWDRFAQKQSGYNAFVSANQALFAGTWPSPPASLIISSGKMASTAIETLTLDAGASVAVVDWVNDSGEGYKLATDEAYVVIINETQGVVSVSSADAVRSDSTVDVDLPANLVAGNVCRAYLAFRRADGTIVSDTAYATGVAA